MTLVFLCHSRVFGQLPVADFTLPGPVCIGEELLLTNNSTDGSSYEWHFCEADIEGNPSAGTTIAPAEFNLSQGFDLIDGDGKWYGFVANRSGNNLLRLDYGSDLNSTPTIADLGNVGSILSGPINIRLFEESSNWYGLVLNFTNSKLIRLSFGTDIESVPTAEDLGTFGQLATPIGIDLVHDGTGVRSVISNNSNTTVSVIDFGASITNTPGASSFTITGGVNLSSIDLMQSGSDWYGIISSKGNNKMFHLDFGTTINNSPVSQEIVIGGLTLSSPIGVELINYKTNYYGFVQSNIGEIYRYDFGSDLAAWEDGVNLGTILSSGSWTIDVAQFGGEIYGFSVSTGNKLSSIDFGKICNATASISTEFEPSGVSYNTDGSYEVGLIVRNALDQFGWITKPIEVNPATASTVDFSDDGNVCIDNPIQFTGSSNGTITSWTWDFGDGSPTENGQMVSHDYMTNGTFAVSLTIINDQGCSNSISKDVSVYNSPVASFSIPPGTLCSNTPITFTNTSTIDPGSPVVWSWDFGDSGSSTEMDPSYIYLTAATYTVELRATLVNGCVSIASQDITLNDGPFGDFSWTGNCWDGIQSNVQFMNESDSGPDITYSWDFGDGSPLNSEMDPVHTYSSASTYTVELEVTDAGTGCITRIENDIEVNDQSLVDFTWTGSTENIAVLFDGMDLTGIGDSAIQWIWTLDSLGISNDEDPSFIFEEEGDYNVSLQINTAQDCIDSLMYQVTINEALKPTVDFSVEGPVCKEGNIDLSNITANAVDYEWHFCMSDVSGPILTSQTSAIPEFDLSQGIDIVDEDGKWYGFVANRNSNSILRLDFGSDLESDPSLFDLGNIDGILNGPINIKVYKEDTVWYALVLNFSGNNLIRFNFGTNLENSPISEDLGDLGLLQNPIGIDVAKDGNSVKSLITNNSNSTIILLDFGLSISNTPIITNFDLSGGLNLSDISLASDGVNWYGFISSKGNDKLYHLDFGSSIDTTPTIQEILDSEVTLVQPVGIDWILYRGVHHLFVQSTVGEMYRFDFGSDLSSWENGENLGTVLTAGSWTMDVLRFGNEVFGFSLSTSDELHSFQFDETCSASESISLEFDPSEIKYLAEGFFEIGMIAYDDSGRFDWIIKGVTIESSIAPDISFTIDANSCSTMSNSFSSTTNSTIESYLWNFDDPASGVDNSSMDPNPSHQYTSTGTYTVRLTVNDGTCSNFIENDITIYNAPVASYSVPAGIICSNSPITFTNTSTFDAGSSVTWQWDFGDQSAVSSEQSASHTYASGGNYTVTLMATMPNCVDVSTQDIFIEEGPATAFSFNNSCNGEPIQFSDLTTSASPLLSWQWDFGDGSTSTLQNPIYSYTSPGSYQVSLTTTNDLGCVTTLTQTVSNHASPVASFYNQLACSNTETFFIDQSTVEGANITEWEWDFGDQSAVSNEQFPAHIYEEAGIYTVSLKVTSNFGCTDSTSVDITVTESPIAAFAWDQSCFGESTQFTDLSSPSPVSPITNWTWMIDGQIIEEQNLSYDFSASGDYPIMLTVTASDFCLSTFVDTLSVNPPPNASFGYTLACEDVEISFFDTSETFNDPIISRKWSIGEEYIFVDDSVTITPKVSGDYVVSLTITTANNCISTVIDTVDISSLPSAGFETNTSLGAYPLTIDFTNTSKEATVFGWSFDEDTLQSVEMDPIYTFMQPGEYEVVLISQNDTGCSDTTIQMVSVVEPVMEAHLIQVIPRSTDGRIELILDIQNNGSITLDESSLDIRISLGTEVQVSETFQDVLYAKEKKNYTLNFDILEGTQERVPFLCVELITKDANYEDIDPENNTACIDLEADPVFVDPYPNPTTDRVSVGIVIPEKDDIKIAWIDSNGKIFFRQTVTDTRAGYNIISFDAQTYGDGIYFVRVGYRGVEETFRVVVD